MLFRSRGVTVLGEAGPGLVTQWSAAHIGSAFTLNGLVQEGKIKVSDSALVVLGGKNENVEKASRNLPTVKTAFVNTINVFDILKYDSFIMTKEAAEKIMEVYV